MRRQSTMNDNSKLSTLGLETLMLNTRKCEDLPLSSKTIHFLSLAYGKPSFIVDLTKK